MQIQQLKNHFFESLESVFPKTEIETFFNWLIKDFLGIERTDVILYPTKSLSTKEVRQFEDAIARLRQQEPIQYILGKTEFFGYDFIVNRDVLIPRPETEELVEWVIKDYQNTNRPLQIIDFCTGSGCIGITLAKELPDVQLTAVDISENAIQIAQKNAENLQVKIQLTKKDILQEDISFHQKYDVIVANPPYVRMLEKSEIKPNVLDYEPSIALFVEDHNPLVFYQKIAEISQESLHKEGSLYFEINQYLAQETKALVEKIGFTDVTLRKDIFNNFRMLKAKF